MGHLKSIVAFHDTKVELEAAEERLGGIPDWMRELHEEHSVKKGEIDAVAEKRDATAQERRAAEGELTDAQEKLKHFQSQISQVATQREYTAVLKEIDTVKDQIAELEKKILEAIEFHDEAEKKVAELEAGFQDLDQQYQGELAKWEAEKPAVATRIEELSHKLREIEGEVPRQYLSLFDRIYQRHGPGSVARVVRLHARGANAMWHCGACSYAVRPQVVVEIRTDGAVSQCESCKRFLFLADEDNNNN